ncbi:hypothetical protein B5F39_00465 [Cloacibacillus sp. An23]|nr:hypothetical protein B5F39_00465 [Cloacibacillus sp. An23]
MAETIRCPIKINLILRVFSKRTDGYHEIYSLFWQKKGIERLTIQQKYDEIIGDSLNITGMKIEGENLVTKALAAVRKRWDAPPLDMTLEKFFPAGSGIGAGSGNAAALIKWLASRGAPLSAEETAKLGADVAFLASGSVMAEARGIGEKMTHFAPPFDFRWLLVFPKWSSGTGDAYAKLDAVRERRADRTEPEPGEDMARIDALARGGTAGLLPNDFYEVSAAEHAEYGEAERIAEASGARGWGLCGSGSAFFGLYAGAQEAEAAARAFGATDWALKTYIVE